MAKSEDPVCAVSECFGHEEGRCRILNNNDFGNRKCPFFKTNEQVEKERAYCRQRLASLRRGGAT